jgi:hypothetical protein
MFELNQDEVFSKFGFIALTIAPQADRIPRNPAESAANDYVGALYDKIVWTDYQPCMSDEPQAFSVLVKSPCDLDEYRLPGFKILKVESVNPGDDFGDSDGTVKIAETDSGYLRYQDDVLIFTEPNE